MEPNQIIYHKWFVGWNGKVKYCSATIRGCLDKGFPITPHSIADSCQVRVVAAKVSTKGIFSLFLLKNTVPVSNGIPNVKEVILILLITVAFMLGLSGNDVVYGESINMCSKAIMLPVLYLGNI